MDNMSQGKACEMNDALVDKLKGKIVKQRTEIARLTMKLEAVTKEKSKLLQDLKWMRGETDEKDI